MKSILDIILESKEPKNFIYKGVTGKILYNALIKALKQECKKNSEYSWHWASKEYEKNIKNLNENTLNKDSIYWLNKIIVVEEIKNKDNYADDQKLYNLFEKYWDIELEGFRRVGRSQLERSYMIAFKFNEDGYSLSSNLGLGAVSSLNKYGSECNYKEIENFLF